MKIIDLQIRLQFNKTFRLVESFEFSMRKTWCLDRRWLYLGSIFIHAWTVFSDEIGIALVIIWLFLLVLDAEWYLWWGAHRGQWWRITVPQYFWQIVCTWSHTWRIVHSIFHEILIAYIGHQRLVTVSQFFVLLYFHLRGKLWSYGSFSTAV